MTGLPDYTIQEVHALLVQRDKHIAEISRLRRDRDALLAVCDEWLPILERQLERFPRPSDGSLEQTDAWKCATGRLVRMRAAIAAARMP
jgi:hypothetical protein